jgi:hypothetical protein
VLIGAEIRPHAGSAAAQARRAPAGRVLIQVIIMALVFSDRA